MSNGAVNFWESGLAWPSTENLEKLAALKGWSLDDLQHYLVKGEQPHLGSLEEVPLEQLLNRIRKLPLSEVVKVAAVCVETIAQRQEVMG